MKWINHVHFWHYYYRLTILVCSLPQGSTSSSKTRLCFSLQDTIWDLGVIFSFLPSNILSSCPFFIFSARSSFCIIELDEPLDCNLVLPNPPLPLSVALRTMNFWIVGALIFSRMSQTILSPTWIGKSTTEWLNRTTPISPR